MNNRNSVIVNVKIFLISIVISYLIVIPVFYIKFIIDFKYRLDYTLNNVEYELKDVISHTDYLITQIADNINILTSLKSNPQIIVKQYIDNIQNKVNYKLIWQGFALFNKKLEIVASNMGSKIIEQSKIHHLVNESNNSKFWLGNIVNLTNNQKILPFFKNINNNPYYQFAVIGLNFNKLLKNLFVKYNDLFLIINPNSEASDQNNLTNIQEISIYKWAKILIFSPLKPLKFNYNLITISQKIHIGLNTKNLISKFIYDQIPLLIFFSLIGLGLGYLNYQLLIKILVPIKTFNNHALLIEQIHQQNFYDKEINNLDLMKQFKQLGNNLFSHLNRYIDQATYTNYVLKNIIKNGFLILEEIRNKNISIADQIDNSNEELLKSDKKSYNKRQVFKIISKISKSLDEDLVEIASYIRPYYTIQNLLHDIDYRYYYNLDELINKYLPDISATTNFPIQLQVDCNAKQGLIYELPFKMAIITSIEFLISMKDNKSIKSLSIQVNTGIFEKKNSLIIKFQLLLIDKNNQDIQIESDKSKLNKKSKNNLYSTIIYASLNIGSVEYYIKSEGIYLDITYHNLLI